VYIYGHTLNEKINKLYIYVYIYMYIYSKWQRDDMADGTVRRKNRCEENDPGRIDRLDGVK